MKGKIRGLCAYERFREHLQRRQYAGRLEDGKPLTQKVVQGLVHRAARKAGLTDSGVHLLRHTFCLHLAMRGATAKAIQELAGHRDLTTTQIYMHLSPAALEDAIRLLDGDGHGSGRGAMVEAAGTENPSH